MYREKIKVLDCTIRDGGLINDHNFDNRFVREVYKAVNEAGVDYIELGYKNSDKIFSRDKFGAWKFCKEEDLKRIMDGIEPKAKLSVMVDVGREDAEAIKPKSESVISMIRTAAYVKEIDKSIQLSNHFSDLGYETTINLMAISRDQGPELEEALHQIENESKVNVIYVVDSFGSLYQESTEHLIKLFKRICKTKEIGFHGHNNQQLAFGNTIEAIIHNANYLDATVYGIGRAAGNCTLELLLGFLKNPKYDLRPILDLISKEFLPLRETMEWGYIIPHALAGMFNEHPKAAIEMRNTDKKDNYREFFEILHGAETH